MQERSGNGILDLGRSELNAPANCSFQQTTSGNFGVSHFSQLRREVGTPYRCVIETPKFEMRLLERLYGGGFVVLYVEDGVKLRDLEQIVDLLGEVQQLQFAALILGGGEGAYEFANA